jgi:hypothetical protein
LAWPKPTRLIALGLLAAALGVVFILDALRWVLPLFMPGSGGIGAVAGGVTSAELAGALALLFAGAGLALFAALCRGRLK